MNTAKKAVIIIDMLNDFVTRDLKSESAQYIIPNLKRLVEAARNNDIPVIYSNDSHYPQDPEVANRWGEHAVKGTKGAEVIPELEPPEKDYVVDKRTYSGFYETGLDLFLRSLGVDTVVLGGLHTNICGRHTTADELLQRIQESDRKKMVCKPLLEKIMSADWNISKMFTTPN